MRRRARSQARRKARVSAGYATVADAARRMRLSAAYLARLEHGGCAPYHTACRLAAVYGCSMNIWM